MILIESWIADQVRGDKSERFSGSPIHSTASQLVIL
jgi:hypothetical protein